MTLAVLDINVILSAALARGVPSQTVDEWLAYRFSVAISRQMIGVVFEKLRLPRISSRLTVEDVVRVVAPLVMQAEIVDLDDENIQVITGDPEDDYVLATCIAANADFLVTGDKRLLELKKHGETQIVSPAVFLLHLNS